MSTLDEEKKFMKASAVDDFDESGKKKVTLDGRDILLARVDGEYYAVDSRCPHLGADLSAGNLEGAIIDCPRHHSRFDIRTGEVVKWTNWPGPLRMLSEVAKAPHPLKVYMVKVEGGDIYVEV